MDFPLLVAIDPKELAAGGWTKADAAARAPNVVKLLKRKAEVRTAPRDFARCGVVWHVRSCAVVWYRVVWWCVWKDRIWM